MLAHVVFDIGHHIHMRPEPWMPGGLMITDGCAIAVAACHHHAAVEYEALHA